MDFLNVSYCPTRKSLEQESWDMVRELSAIAGRILGAAGVDHAAFDVAAVESKRLCALIREANRQVQAHRAEHGC